MLAVVFCTGPLEKLLSQEEQWTPCLGVPEDPSYNSLSSPVHLCL